MKAVTRLQHRRTFDKLLISFNPLTVAPDGYQPLFCHTVNRWRPERDRDGDASA
jgi:hypothetical protein